ncbi:MAG: MATE family efflux transporter [Clostridia bacterium]|nr:MATE family efflux transporter [Clostridia bacterium]
MKQNNFYIQMLKLAVPIALQNLLVSSFTLVDTLMVGQLGDTELAAVGMAGQWSWLLQIILFGIVSGMSIFVAQYWGEKNIDGIHRVYGIALASGAVLSLIFAALAFFVPESVMSIFNREADVVAAGASYLRIVAFSYPAVMLGNIMFALMRSTECVKIPMVISLISTVFNAVFNYGFIFGKFGLPEMGIRGAALATCISAWVSPLAAVAISKAKKLILSAPLKKVFGFTRTMVSEFYKKATPVILNEGMWGLGTFVITLLYSNLGSEYYAAVTILKTFENIAFTIFIGICNASCVMIGKSIGAGNIEEGISVSKKMAVIVPLIAVPIGALIIIFREQLVHLFNMSGNLTAETLRTAIGITTVYALEIPIRNIPYIQIVGIFRPGGETSRGLVYDIGCLWALSIPATAIAAYLLKLDFVLVYIIMYVFEDIPKSILCLKYFFTNKWIKPVTDAGREGLKIYFEKRGTHS